MDSKKPKSIFTDQDAAMSKAIEQVQQMFTNLSSYYQKTSSLEVLLSTLYYLYSELNLKLSMINDRC